MVAEKRGEDAAAGRREHRARRAADEGSRSPPSCETDEWSPQVIECVANATGREALDACDAMLTPQQRANEHKRDDELLKTAVQPLQKPDPDKSRRDPHDGLGIPPGRRAAGATPLGQGSGQRGSDA